MMKWTAFLSFVALALTACTQSESPAPEVDAPADVAQPTSTAAGVDVHEDSLTLDTHVDIDFEFATDTIDPLNADIQVNLEKMQAGGLDAAFFIVYVGQTERTAANYRQAADDAMTKFDAIHRMTERLYPERIGLAYRADDVERLIDEGKLAAAIGIENGYVIGTDLEVLERYYDLGARYMTLVHNGHNDIADSASPRPQFGDADVEHDGVGTFGAAVIRRMNELGMMVDISHGSKQTALDAIELSQAPVIASHSSIRARADHVRNLDDETLQRLRDNGGVVQIVAFESYVKVRPDAYEEAVTALRDRLAVQSSINLDDLDESIREQYTQGMTAIEAQWPPSNVEQFVDHIDYAVELIGIDHVGISSDFGGGGGIDGWSDALETPNITAELVRRGYSAEDIAKIWSGNLLRVWREVEEVAERL